MECLNGFGRYSNLKHAVKSLARAGANCALHFLRRLSEILSRPAALF